MSFIGILVQDVSLLLAVAFYTLLERKVLGYIQLRKGPNKVGYLGVPQPLADAAKLFTKEQVVPSLANQAPYFFAPVVSLTLALGMWTVFPVYGSGFYSFSLAVIFFLCLSSLNVYGTLVAGWSSNSKYALLGAFRAVAQTISYEVSLILVLLSGVFIVGSYNLLSFVWVQMGYFSVFLVCVPVAFVWFVTTLAETNRAPFDFAEGESEIVSGFNIEYSAGGFALIFMAEYGSILVMSLMSAVLFFGGLSLLDFSFGFSLILKVCLVGFVFLWVRGSLPRMRYDKLMGLAWKSFLPVSLGFLSFVCGFCFLF